jgi:hypothetical protein
MDVEVSTYVNFLNCQEKGEDSKDNVSEMRSAIRHDNNMRVSFNREDAEIEGNRQ